MRSLSVTTSEGVLSAKASAPPTAASSADRTVARSSDSATTASVMTAASVMTLCDNSNNSNIQSQKAASISASASATAAAAGFSCEDDPCHVGRTLEDTHRQLHLKQDEDDDVVGFDCEIQQHISSSISSEQSPLLLREGGGEICAASPQHTKNNNSNQLHKDGDQIIVEDTFDPLHLQSTSIDELLDFGEADHPSFHHHEDAAFQQHQSLDMNITEEVADATIPSRSTSNNNNTRTRAVSADHAMSSPILLEMVDINLLDGSSRQRSSVTRQRRSAGGAPPSVSSTTTPTSSSNTESSSHRRQQQQHGLRASLDSGMATLRRWIRSRAAAPSPASARSVQGAARTPVPWQQTSAAAGTTTATDVTYSSAGGPAGGAEDDIFSGGLTFHFNNNMIDTLSRTTATTASHDFYPTTIREEEFDYNNNNNNQHNNSDYYAPDQFHTTHVHQQHHENQQQRQLQAYALSLEQSRVRAQSEPNVVRLRDFFFPSSSAASSSSSSSSSVPSNATPSPSARRRRGRNRAYTESAPGRSHRHPATPQYYQQHQQHQHLRDYYHHQYHHQYRSNQQPQQQYHYQQQPHHRHHHHVRPQQHQEQQNPLPIMMTNAPPRQLSTSAAAVLDHQTMELVLTSPAAAVTPATTNHFDAMMVGTGTAASIREQDFVIDTSTTAAPTSGVEFDGMVSVTAADGSIVTAVQGANNTGIGGATSSLSSQQRTTGSGGAPNVNSVAALGSSSLTVAAIGNSSLGTVSTGELHRHGASGNGVSGSSGSAGSGAHDEALTGGRRRPHRPSAESPPVDPEREARMRWMRINRRFQLVITIVAILFSLLLFAILLCWVVLTSTYVVSFEKECDVPLRGYFWLVTLQLILDVFRADILRCIFRWDSNSREPIPCRVIIYNISYLIYAIMVLRLGVRSVFVDPTTCKETAPQLFKATAAFVTLSIAAWGTIVCGYVLPLCVVAALLTYNGYNPSAAGLEGGEGGTATQPVFPAAYSTTGAPPWCVEQIQTIRMSDFTEELPHTTECCICMEDFNEDDIMVKTACGHIFHKVCCREWLRQARTCPVCRSDIPSTLEETTPGGVDPTTGVRSVSGAHENESRIPVGLSGRPVAGLLRFLQRGGGAGADEGGNARNSSSNNNNNTNSNNSRVSNSGGSNRLAGGTTRRGGNDEDNSNNSSSLSSTNITTTVAASRGLTLSTTTSRQQAVSDVAAMEEGRVASSSGSQRPLR